MRNMADMYCTSTLQDNEHCKDHMWKQVVESSPRKADGETVPLLRATMTLMPVSTNGTEKSMISERSSLIVREPIAMSALLYTT